jgi:hypothetical protein
MGERRDCGCIDRLDKLLAERNTSLVVTIPTADLVPQVVLRTEIVEKRRGARPVCMVATFCPFCGKEYPYGKRT